MYKIWRINKLIALFILQSFSSLVVAVEIEYGLEVSLANYENIDRTVNPSQDEWVESIIGRISAVENTSDMVANISASIETINYRNNQQEDTTVNNLNANGLWIISPRQFEWFLSDIYSQRIINPLLNNTQSNRQNVNAVSTGPNYYWRLNSKNNLNLEARYENIDFEDTSGDNDRLNSALRWVYLINSSLTGSVNSEIENVKFKGASLNNFIRNNIFVRIDYNKGRNILLAEAGIAEINYEAQNDVATQQYLIALQNQRNSTSNVRFEYVRELTDSSTQLITTLPGMESQNADAAVLNTELYTQDNIILRYSKELSFGDILFDASKYRRKYENQSIYNQQGNIGLIRATYNVSQSSTFDFETRLTNTNYDNLNPKRVDEEVFTRLRHSYVARRNLSLSFSVESVKRKSTDTLNNYKDKMIYISLIYSSR